MPQITTAAVAQKAGKSVRTILRLVRSGELPYVAKFPTDTGGYLFDEAVADRVVEARFGVKSSAAA